MKTRSPRNLMTRRWWGHHDRLLALLEEQISSTRSDPGLAGREDVLSMLVRARDEEGRGLSDHELQNDLLALIAAGHETTAAAISWGGLLLAQNPEARERAVHAAREGDDAYLAALVKEVLRIRPPLPIAAGRRMEEPFPIGPHLVPAGTPILIDSWGLHHDPALYPDPGEFRPERFLERGPDPYAWLPFGGGAHRCIGSGLAELEIKIALSTILSRVAIAPAAPEMTPLARRGIVMVPHAGGRIRIV
jgi:cytochrome P450